MSEYPTVVIGAGPYGLSVAAHLKGARVPTLIFGKPMEFWQSFPRGMNLRSAWSASSLSDPEGDNSLDRFTNRACGQSRRDRVRQRLSSFNDIRQRVTRCGRWPGR